MIAAQGRAATSTSWWPAIRRGFPWVGVFGIVLGMQVRHMLHMPSGDDWNDTYVYAGAASDFLTHPGQLYDGARLQSLSDIAQRVFIYPPAGLLPFLPLVPLTRGAGITATAALWSWIDTLALIAAIILAGRRLGLDAERLGWAIIVLCLSGPIALEVDAGQVNGVVLLLLVLSWERFPKTSSGVLLGLALGLKPVAPLLLVVPLLLGRPRTTAVALATLLLLNLPLLPFIGADGIGFYLFHFLPFIQSTPIHDAQNLSLANVLQTWVAGRPLTPQDPAGLSALQSATAASVLLWGVRAGLVALWAWAVARRRRPPFELFVLTAALTPLLAATAWPHYYVLALPAVILALRSPSLVVQAAAWAGMGVVLWESWATRFWGYDPASTHASNGLMVFLARDLLPLLTAALVVALALGRSAERRPRPRAAAETPMFVPQLARSAES
jgi:hypothetical protein